MKISYLTALLLVIFTFCTAAQEFTMPELSGYKKVTKYPVFTADNLHDFNNGATENYIAYGFVDLHVAEYRKGKNIIKLEIYRHGDNNLAFGIYSAERSPSFRYLILGAQGYKADGAINFFKGNYYVKIRTSSKNEKTLQASESLAQKVANMLPGDSKTPALLSRFPETGKLVNGETYVNGNVLGHQFLNKAFKALYTVGSDNFSLFIFEKNSTEEVKKSVDAYLKTAGLEAAEGDSGKYMFTDGPNGTIFLAWNENEIVIISGLSKDQTALADQYTTEIMK
jgi:hypothetical protein